MTIHKTKFAVKYDLSPNLKRKLFCLLSNQTHGSNFLHLNLSGFFFFLPLGHSQICRPESRQPVWPQAWALVGGYSGTGFVVVRQQFESGVIKLAQHRGILITMLMGLRMLIMILRKKIFRFQSINWLSDLKKRSLWSIAVGTMLFPFIKLHSVPLPSLPCALLLLIFQQALKHTMFLSATGSLHLCSHLSTPTSSFLHLTKHHFASVLT
jgi:hypothetical protein